MKTCIITIIKNEQDYLEQWIAYHINLGIDTLFVFEDVGSESHAYITDKYEQVRLMSVLDVYYNDNDRNIAIRRRKENKPMQNQFQNMAYRKFTKEYDWCIVMDVDEYITCERPFNELLEMYKGYDAVVMQWQNYNANGHYRRPQLNYNLIDTYTEKCGFSDYDEEHKLTSKMILNCKTYKLMFCHHYPSKKYKWCYTNLTQDEDRKIYDNIYIRHYITKSYEEYLHKLYVRGMSYVVHRDDKEFFKYNPNMTDKQKIKEVKDLYDLCK